MLKSSLFFLGLIALSIASSEFEVKQQFAEYKQKFNKSYSDEEHEFRFANFKSALDRIAASQAREKGTATYGLTKFSDLSPAEFRSKYLMPSFNKAQLPTANVSSIPLQSALPTTWDWNTKGAITPVKNQGQCGSCWAFSATETIESYWILAGHTTAILSPQQIVDCDSNDYGCNGGWPYNAYQYVISQGGLDTEASYPYTAVDGTCAFQASSVGAKITAWSYITQSQDENVIQNWIYSKGPASICVDASSWSEYTGGVISSCTTNIDHCVQLTGFSTQGGVEAWNVRNSWGADWGVSGYIYLERGQNTCAMAEVVTAVTSA